MTRGRAAKVAIDAQVLVAYLDSLTEYRTDGVPRRRRRYINGHGIDMDVDARTIRRWRTSTEGVTPAAAERLLHKVQLNTGKFYIWAKAHSREPMLRGFHG